MNGNARNTPSTSKASTSQRSGQEKCTSRSCNCILRALKRADEYLQESNKLEEKQQLEREHETLKLKYETLKQRYLTLKRQNQTLELQWRKARGNEKPSTRVVMASSSSDLQEEEETREDTEDDEIEVIRNNTSVAGPSRKRKARLAVEYMESSRGKAIKVLSEMTEEDTRPAPKDEDISNSMTLMNVLNYAQRAREARNAAAHAENRWICE